MHEDGFYKERKIESMKQQLFEHALLNTSKLQSQKIIATKFFSHDDLRKELIAEESGEL